MKAKEKAIKYLKKREYGYDAGDYSIEEAIDIAIQETKKEMLEKIENHKTIKEERKNKLEESISLRGKLGEEHTTIVIEIDAINELKRELEGEELPLLDGKEINIKLSKKKQKELDKLKEEGSPNVH